jgi:hypothetical protein
VSIVYSCCRELLSGDQPVHRVGRDALSAMDRGGIAETGRGLNVVDGEPCSEMAAVVSNGQVAAATYSGDRPPVTVLDPVVGCESESAVVAAGDDHIADTALVPIRQAHLAAGQVTAEEMITGLSVEFVDELSGGGEHDPVEAFRPVGNPRVERILDRGGYVTDMDAAVIKVEVECLWFAFAEGE